MIAANKDGAGGFNVEKRQDMKKRFDHVRGHDQAREMRITKGKNPRHG